MIRFVVAAAVVVALSPAVGCTPPPPADGCTPNDTRCSPLGLPQTCSPSQRWAALPLALPCVDVGAVCCRVHGRTRDLYACAPNLSACVSETAGDAGVME